MGSNPRRFNPGTKGLPVVKRQDRFHAAPDDRRAPLRRIESRMRIVPAAWPTGRSGKSASAQAPAEWLRVKATPTSKPFTRDRIASTTEGARPD
jgi:hypothetical protein